MSTCLSSPHFTSAVFSTSSLPPSDFPPRKQDTVPKSHHWTEAREVSAYKGFTFSALLLQGTKVWHPVFPTAQPAELAKDCDISWSPGRCLDVYPGSLAGWTIWSGGSQCCCTFTVARARGRTTGWLQCWSRENCSSVVSSRVSGLNCPLLRKVLVLFPCVYGQGAGGIELEMGLQWPCSAQGHHTLPCRSPTPHPARASWTAASGTRDPTAAPQPCAQGSWRGEQSLGTVGAAPSQVSPGHCPGCADAPGGLSASPIPAHPKELAWHSLCRRRWGVSSRWGMSHGVSTSGLGSHLWRRLTAWPKASHLPAFLRFLTLLNARDNK